MSIKGWIDRSFWQRIPEIVGHLSFVAGAMLADGQYLRRSAWTGLAAPVVLIALAVAAGATHPQWLEFHPRSPAFSSSLPFILLALATGVFSAQWGLFVCLGYIAGDLALHVRPDEGEQLATYGGLAISYALLIQLCCVIPLSARMLAVAAVPESLGAGRFAPLLPALRIFTASAFLFLFLYSWIAAFPYLVRPVHGFGDVTPQISTVAPIQMKLRTAPHPWHPIIVTAEIMLVARLLLERFWRTDQPSLDLPTLRPLNWHPMIAFPAKSAFMVAMLAGLINSWLAAGLTFAAFLALFSLHYLSGARLRRWYDIAQRVPLILRLGLAGLASFGLSYGLLTYVLPSALSSIIICGVIGAALICFIVPPRPLEGGRKDGAQ